MVLFRLQSSTFYNDRVRSPLPCRSLGQHTSASHDRTFLFSVHITENICLSYLVRILRPAFILESSTTLVYARTLDLCSPFGAFFPRTGFYASQERVVGAFLWVLGRCHSFSRVYTSLCLLRSSLACCWMELGVLAFSPKSRSFSRLGTENGYPYRRWVVCFLWGSKECWCLMALYRLL